MITEYPIVWLMEELRDGKSKLGEPDFEARLLRATFEMSHYSSKDFQKCSEQLIGLVQPFCSILERPEIAKMFDATHDVELIKELGKNGDAIYRPRKAEASQAFDPSLNQALESELEGEIKTLLEESWAAESRSADPSLVRTDPSTILKRSAEHIIDYPNLVNPDEHFAEKWNSAIFGTILDPDNILGDDFKSLLSDVNKDPKLLDSPEFSQRIQAIADGDPEIAAKLENRRQVLNNLLKDHEQITKVTPPQRVARRIRDDAPSVESIFDVSGNGVRVMPSRPASRGLSYLSSLDPAVLKATPQFLEKATDKQSEIFSENGDWIVKSSYWGNYSRSLQRMGGDFNRAYEVSVSPINSSSDSEWEELKLVRVRDHCTPEKATNFTHRIPVSVMAGIRSKLGDEWWQPLLHEDLLSEIDPELWKRQQQVWTIGGGIPFVLICKDLTNYQPLVEYWLEYLAKNPNYQRYSVRTEAYFREALELIKRKQETDMEPKEHPFAEFVNYVIDPTNMWAPEKYIPARSVSMVFRGKEVKVSYQYLMGSGYLEGSIEEMCFRIFFSMNQGFQIFLFAMGTDPKEAGRPMNYPPYEAKKVIEYFDGLFQQFTTQN